MLFVLLHNTALAKPQKIRCNKPIYFFENASKNEFFDYVDETLQKNKYDVKKFYPELGFLTVNYKTKKHSTEIISINLKQYGNDLYLFIDTTKKNTKLEQDIYKNLKKHSQNSYLITDDYFCKELTKDVNSINKARKNYLKDDIYNPFVYQISMKRYIGYDKKTYFLNEIKSFFKNRKKKEKV